MRTCGLSIVLYNGRYFTSYHGSDAYPEGLGRDILYSIPQDPRKYQAWLARQRAEYDRKTTDLERQILTTTAENIDSLLEEGLNDDDEYEENIEWLAWKYIDPNLKRMPSALFDAGGDRWVDYTYLTDLDNERFSVNNAIIFDLGNIPRDRWIQALGFAENCPEALRCISPIPYFADDIDERNACHKLYEDYGCTTFDVETNIAQSVQKSPYQILALAVFEQFTDSPKLPFWDYVPAYCHDAFAFRELSFAILSFAAGMLSFDTPARYYGRSRGDGSEGYLARIDDAGQPHPMSLFAFGCHLPDQLPGSSPAGSIYTIGDVVVFLVPDSVFTEDVGAAIAKSVVHARVTGRVSFSAVLFSIFNAVLVEVHTEEGQIAMRHSNVFPVYDSKRWHKSSTQPANSKNASGKDIHPLDRLYSVHHGFAALQHFFDNAAIRSIPACSRGVFALDIYAIIIAHADTTTRQVCAMVSKTFYRLCQRYFAFSEDITVTNFARASCVGSATRPSLSAYQQDLGSLGKFTFCNQRTGLISRSSLEVPCKERIVTWCPVIGAGGRASLVAQVQLGMSLLP